MLQNEQIEEYEAQQRKGVKRSESVEKAQVRTLSPWGKEGLPRLFAGRGLDWAVCPPRAGGRHADCAESCEPPRHLQAKGESRARGHGDASTARYGLGTQGGC